jgi:hypothetical protein
MRYPCGEYDALGKQRDEFRAGLVAASLTESRNCAGLAFPMAGIFLDSLGKNPYLYPDAGQKSCSGIT